MTRHGSHTESRMRENCTYGSMRGIRRKTAKHVLRVAEGRAGVPHGASRSTLHPPSSRYNSTRFCSMQRVANIPRFALHVRNASRRNRCQTGPQLCTKPRKFSQIPPLLSNRKYPIIRTMANEWIVEFTDEFELWWLELSELVQEKCAAVVDLLTREGPNLGFPYSSSIRGAAHALRELRIQCGGHPYRILYAFDPQRNALLILGGDKTGNDRWYEENVPRAERIYEQYFKEIEEEAK